MMKKHGKEYAEVLQEYEEAKQRESGIETGEIVEEKDQEWKLKIEEILSLMKEMTRGQKEKEEEKTSKNESHKKPQENFQSKEWERCGKILRNKLSERKRRNMRCVKYKASRRRMKN